MGTCARPAKRSRIPPQLRSTKTCSIAAGAFEMTSDRVSDWVSDSVSDRVSDSTFRVKLQWECLLGTARGHGDLAGCFSDGDIVISDVLSDREIFISDGFSDRYIVVDLAVQMRDTVWGLLQAIIEFCSSNHSLQMIVMNAGSAHVRTRACADMIAYGANS